MSAAVLNFDEIDHTYTVDGIDYPSITSVIEAAGLVDFSMIPAEDLKFYQDRGTALHQACWYSDDGDLNEATVDPLVTVRLEFWRKFRRDLPFQILVSERRLFDRTYRYAGTPDRLVKFPDGSKGVIELKSGPLQPAVAVQLAAQANLFEPGGGSLRRYAVHLGATGYSLKEFRLASMKADLSVFLSCLTTYIWKREHL